MPESHATLIDQLFRRDPALLDDPSPAYHRLREVGPVLRLDGSPQGPPWLNAWHVVSYDGVAASLRDERFSSRRQMAAMPLEHFGIDPSTPQARFFWTVQAETMLTMDAPDHTRLRRLSLKAFTPPVVESLRGEIQAIVSRLLGEADQRHPGGFDLMAEFAAPLPAIVIAHLLGIPPQDWQQFKQWSDGVIGFNITQAKIDNFWQLGQYLRARIAERRQHPQDDLISGLIAARDESDALTEDEMVGQCVILLVGGHETTTFAIGNAVRRLLADRALWESLPDVAIESAVEELLRIDSPFQALARKAMVDLQIGTQEVAEGDTLWLWIAAANHDPARFPDPDRLDFSRQDNRHLSFGLGPHYCLGAALARLELQIAVSALRERYPALHLASDTVDWKRDGAIRGPRTLPVITQ